MNSASPNLDNLRKRAKSLLRQHTAREFPVAERIRRALPRYRGCSDREVLDASFSLALAQEVVAHELGFEDWEELRRGVETMSSDESTRTTSDSPAEPEALCAHPQVFVTDLERAAAFYRDRLGFSVEYLYGEPPYYGLVSRGGAAINLRHVDASPFDTELRDRESLLAAAIVVRHAKALFLAYQEAGLEFHQRYREQPWGAHDFIVRDPDGNLIHFASPVGDP